MASRVTQQRLRDANCRKWAMAHKARGTDRVTVFSQIMDACANPDYFHQAPHMVTAAREAKLLPPGVL